MKILVVGVGAMGSIYAGMLAEAGNEVWISDTFEQHLKEIEQSGLFISGASGKRMIPHLNISRNLDLVGVCDLIIIATKAYAVDSAARTVKNNINRDSVILTIQNGLGSGEKLNNVLKTSNILLGVAGGFGASIIRPGHVHHHDMKVIRLGEMFGGETKRLEMIAGLWKKAGFYVETFSDINQLIWEKFICNVAVSGAAAAFNRTVGEIIEDPITWEIAKKLGIEAFSVGKAKNIAFTFNEPIKYIKDFFQKMPNAKPSMLLDLEAHRKTEVESINGAVPIIAQSLGLNAPYNEVIAAIIKTKESQF